MIEHALTLQDLYRPARQTPADPVSAEAVREQLERMLRCKLFAQSPRLKRFLQFTVEQALADCGARLKEYLLGIEVFGKDETFDPRLDSIVRVEARRLRAKVNSYYETDGRQDEVMILFRPGEYTPRFFHRRIGADGTMPAVDSGRPRVLLVGQGDANHERLAKDLTRLGYEVAGPVTSLDQLSQWARNEPSALVCVAAAGSEMDSV